MQNSGEGVVITMGDPAGIGPEIIAKLALARPREGLVVIGDQRAFAGIAEPNLIAAPWEAKPGLNLIDLPAPIAPIPGKGDARNAGAILGWINEAHDLIERGEARAMLTAPINKAIVRAGADFPFGGHTELLAHLDEAPRAVMMLSADLANTGVGSKEGEGAADILRVIPATIHVALRDVPKLLSPDLLREIITIADAHLRARLGRAPRLAIAGLNPHAGEEGAMGNEEVEWIAPFIAQMRGEGYQLSGPHPADSLFHQRARAQYDACIAMYHDQALIPIKTLAFDWAVNVTLGLSFLRTSPDHGTGFDIAGTGKANPRSMIAAFDWLCGAR